jgi:hypothetical protein
MSPGFTRGNPKADGLRLMRKLLPNVPASPAAEEKISGSIRVVRRTEVTVERRVCSIEIRSVAQLPNGLCCPICGVNFTTGSAAMQDEVK